MAKNFTITRNHPARKDFAELPQYFKTKGEALYAIDDILNSYGMELDWEGRYDLYGDEGNRIFAISPDQHNRFYCDDCERQIEVGNYNNVVNFSYYRMPSGRYEIVAYIS